MTRGEELKKMQETIMNMSEEDREIYLYGRWVADGEKE